MTCAKKTKFAWSFNARVVYLTAKDVKSVLCSVTHGHETQTWWHDRETFMCSKPQFKVPVGKKFVCIFSKA